MKVPIIEEYAKVAGISYEEALINIRKVHKYIKRHFKNIEPLPEEVFSKKKQLRKG